MTHPLRILRTTGGRSCRSLFGRGAIVACLILRPGLGARAGDHPPPQADVESPRASTSVVGAGALDARLRRLEELDTIVREQNRRLAEQNRQLVEQNRRLAEQNRGLSRQLDAVSRRQEELVGRLDRMAVPASAPDPSTSIPPLPDRMVEDASGSGVPFATPEALPEEPAAPDPVVEASPFRIGGYDREKSQFILVEPRDPERTPFALNFDVITQARYTGFSRSSRTWTDSAGVVLPVRSYDTIEINRNWFQFSGYALDPRFQFMAVIFSSSTDNATLFLGWLDYRFNRAFTLSTGYYKVPGSREWIDSFRYTLGADRTMATTFFRPGFSPGVWASGEPLTGVHYIAMVANSFNGENLANNRFSGKTDLAFAGSLWWEPTGRFGPGPSDIEWHERPALRIGSSFTVSREPLAGATAVQTNPENTLFRLSDGTPLAAAGSLGPGVLINTTSVQLWAIDAAVKYRGLSLSGEYYFRWLDDFQYTGGPLRTQAAFADGAYAQSSYFIIPKRLEAFARFSFVTGGQGGGNEWGGGLNWYVLARRNWRMTFDVTRINHSPADNILTGYRAGESGTLFQLQMLSDF